MKLQDCLNGIFSALPEDTHNKLVELFEPDWAQSVASYSSDWSALRKDYVGSQLLWCQFRDAVAEPLQKAHQTIRQQPELSLLGWHCHRLLFDTPDYMRIREWVELIALLNQFEEGLGGTFFLWIALETVNRLKNHNVARGVPEAITKSTLEDIGNMENRYARVNHGRVGLSPMWSMNWLRTMASGNLHRVGRLSYIPRKFRGQVQVYRHRLSQQTVALSDPDIRCNSEGYFALETESVAWTTSLRANSETISGHPVQVNGMISKSPITLDLQDWQLVLNQESDVLEIHIPENGPLNNLVTLQSFLEAKTFFQRHYPEHHAVAFACYSWMLNPQLKTFLGDQSNLVAWQEEFYLFPFTSSGKDGLYFVLGTEEFDSNTPRDTRLRKAMLEHLESGQSLRTGGMFFQIQDLTLHGQKPYQLKSF